MNGLEKLPVCLINICLNNNFSPIPEIVLQQIQSHSPIMTQPSPAPFPDLLQQHMQTNRSFIEDKLNEMFRVQLQQPNPTINTINQNKLELLIKQVLETSGIFAESPQMDQFVANLPQNIAKFCQKEKLMDISTVMELLEYCLENGMKQKEQPKEKVVESKVEKVEPAQPVKLDLNDVFERSIMQYQELLKQPSLPREERTILEASLNNMKLQQLSVRSEQRKKVGKSLDQVQEEPQNNPERTPKPPPQLSQKEILIRKLKPLFEFACEQQQNTGKNSTFDRLHHQRIHLNLGSFLILCNDLKISNNQITRFVLIEKFKKIADGSQQLTFDKFIKVLEVLSSIDPAIYDNISMQIASNKSPKPKSIRAPFSIHDKEFFREIRQANSARKQLTSHSGKLSYSLREQLQNRKLLRSSAQRYDKQQQPQNTFAINNRSQIFQQPSLQNSSRLSDVNLKLQKSVLTLEHLKSVADELQLKRISRLIVREDDDDFMKNYHVEEFRKKRRNTNIAINTRKRADEMSKLEHSKQAEQEQKAVEMTTGRFIKPK